MYNNNNNNNNTNNNNTTTNNNKQLGCTKSTITLLKFSLNILKINKISRIDNPACMGVQIHIFVYKIPCPSTLHEKNNIA